MIRQTVLTHAAIAAAAIALTASVSSYAGSSHQSASDPVARAQIAQINQQMGAVAAQLATINLTLDSRLFKLCKATVTNPAYIGCN